jgi:hypothetical protein
VKKISLIVASVATLCLIAFAANAEKVGNLKVGVGAKQIESIRTFTTASTDISSIASKATGTVSFTAAGLKVGDIALLMKADDLGYDGGADNTLEDGLAFRCLVKVDGYITCEFSNNTASAIDPPARTYTFLIIDLNQ